MMKTIPRSTPTGMWFFNAIHVPSLQRRRGMPEAKPGNFGFSKKAFMGFASLFLAVSLSAQQLDSKKETPTMENENVKTVHDLTLSAAQKFVSRGLQLAEERQLKLAIAVTDRSGALVAFARMDGASLVTVEVAVGKAKSAVWLQAPSKLFEDFVDSGKPSMATTPGILPLQGGMPVLYRGEIIGAVGVSGSSGESDNAVATLIANHLFKNE